MLEVPDRVVFGGADPGFCRLVEVEPVGAGLAEQCVFAGSTNERVVADVGMDDVVAAEAGDLLGKDGAIERWIAGTAEGVGDIGSGTTGHFIRAHEFSKHAGELHYLNGLLQGDVDGDGVADFTIKVGHHLQADDLIL